jgi:hypothetical protein
MITIHPTKPAISRTFDILQVNQWVSFKSYRVKLKPIENGYTLTPLMLLGVCNCMFNGLMACCSQKDIFNVVDPAALCYFTYETVLQRIRDSSLKTNFQTVFHAYRDEQDSVSLYLYAHDHLRDKVWPSKLDAPFFSMVYGIIIVIISIVPENIPFNQLFSLICLGFMH